MAMEAQQQKKRRYCDCGFEISSLSDYHTAEHKKSKRHRQAMTASKMQRLDNFFSKAGPAHREATAVELEPSTEFRQLQLGESYLHTRISDSARHQQCTLPVFSAAAYTTEAAWLLYYCAKSTDR